MMGLHMFTIDVSMARACVFPACSQIRMLANNDTLVSRI